MSRIRTVKPELFKHEDLFDAEQNSKLPLRLAFIGLFTIADREGRFRWRPRTLKLDVLPHDFIDFAAILNALEQAGFIERYEVDGESYGWIPTFTKHQRFTGKEAETKSLLPPPQQQGNRGETLGKHPDASQEIHRETPGEHPGTQDREWNKGKGREGKGEEAKSAARAPEPLAPLVEPTPAEPEPQPQVRSKPGKAIKPDKPAKTALPADFAITPELQAWADQKGYGDLSGHLDSFKDKAQAKGYQYADWNAAFRSAVRDDWAGLRKPDLAAPGGSRAPPGDRFDAHAKHARLVAANQAAVAEWLAQEDSANPWGITVLPPPELNHAAH